MGSRRRGWCLLCAAVLFPAMVAAAEQPSGVGSLAFLGQAVVEPGLEVEGTPVGGLSALTWDATRSVYYALSDDPGQRAPSRLYTLEIDLDGGRLEENGVRVVAVTHLSDRAGEPFPKGSFDGEGLALTAGRTLMASSEGFVRTGVPPSLWEFDLEGRALRRLRLPRRFRPNRSGTRGVRHNVAFEALGVSPEGGEFFVAVENALAQDGPPASLDGTSPCRIVRFDLATGRALAEYVYLIDPIAAAPDPPDAFAVNGLVEIVPLGGDRLLALERSFSVGAGNSIRLYEAELGGATDVRRRRTLRAARLRPVRKELLLDLADLEVPLDNFEGVAFGPLLPDGRRSLLIVSDDNFSPWQRTRVLAFAVDPVPPPISTIQGAGHRSPREGAWVRGVTGVVTAVERSGDSPGFWIQDADDGDPSTSDGLSVRTEDPPPVEVGDAVRVDGRVVERGFRGGLPVTRLIAARVGVAGRQRALPAPVTLGPGGRSVPPVIDDDRLTEFQPVEDAVDFFESLEGMRVEVPDAVVVGPTHYGRIVVLPAEGEGVEPRTPRGGLLLRPEDTHPQRLSLSWRLLGDPRRLDVGDRLPGRLEAVLDYDYDHYRLLLTEAPPEIVAAEPPPVAPTLHGAARQLTVATYNVHNLSAHSPDEHFSRLARSIVEGLGAPDLLALQEIQDDTGAEDDGTVSAARTLERLLAGIRAAGGPEYVYRQVDPEDGRDGGRPGANIRSVFLFDPQRLAFADRGGEESRQATVVDAPDGPHLEPNPGRIAPGDPAFEGDEETGRSGSRKPLVAELQFAGRTLFVINLHLVSKRGDDPLMGANQPPRAWSEAQRLEQVRVVGRLVERLRELDPCALIVVLGDMNDFEFSAPMAAFAGYGLVNLTESVPPPERYSFNYEGNSQLLDHILVSPPLAATSDVEILIAHLNADFAAADRASDHDPVVARLTVPDPPTCPSLRP